MVKIQPGAGINLGEFRWLRLASRVCGEVSIHSCVRLAKILRFLFVFGI